MNRTEALDSLQESIGYVFQDGSLLETALTHRSYCNENKNAMEDNERLEFLGDAVVNLAIAASAYRIEPEWDEGRLTRLKALVVCGTALGLRGRALGLGHLLRLGKGAAREDRVGDTSSVLSDVFEALVGAIFQDGGFEPAQRFVLEQLEPYLQECHDRGRMTDPKSALQAICLKKARSTPDYGITSREGPAHDPQFEVRVTLPDGSSYEGTGRSRKEAEQAAALTALEALGEEC